MADQNQDLPLVVSEILIEMHELRGDIKELQKVTVHLSHSVAKLETSVDKLQVEMHEVKGAIVQLAGSIKTLADESRSNTEMIIAAFREEGLYVRQLLQQHDARITRLEDNQPNK
jgi:chromosome segregation ATPase